MPAAALARNKMFPLVSGEALALAGECVNGREWGIVGCIVALFFLLFSSFFIVVF